MRFARRLRQEPCLTMLHWAPLVSVALLVVLFSLFFSSFSAPPGVRVPAVSGRMPYAALSRLRLTVTQEGVLIEGQAVTADQLEELLREVSGRGTEVLITASRRVPLETVMRVWRSCGNAGIARVSLVTD